jgi:predicted transcriptional regulator
MTLEHQDWKSVVFTDNKTGANKSNVTRSIQDKQKTNQLSKSLISDEIGELKKYSKEFIEKVRKMRSTYPEIKTQELLARKLQVTTSVINQLEQGKGYDGKLVNKINQLETRLAKNATKV